MSAEDKVVSGLISWQEACIILLKRQQDEFGHLILYNNSDKNAAVYVNVFSSMTKSAFLRTTFPADPSPTYTKCSHPHALTHRGKLTTRAQVSSWNTCAMRALSAGAENNKLLHVYFHGAVTHIHTVYTHTDVEP